MARVAVMVQTISPLVTPNSRASESTRKTRTKKSNASIVQPRNPAVTACHGRDCVGEAAGTADIVELGEHGIFGDCKHPYCGMERKLYHPMLSNSGTALRVVSEFSRFQEVEIARWV